MLADMLGSLPLLSGAMERVAGVFSVFGLNPALCKGFAGGFIEVTRGCLEIAKASAPLAEKLPPVSFLLSFSGGCILAQCFSYLEKCGVSKLRYTVYKLAQGVLSSGVCGLL
jgi:hypothetical protein